MTTRDAIHAVRSDSALTSASNTIHSAFKKRKVADTNTTEGSNMNPPLLEVNNVPLESDSTETVMSNPTYNSKEKEYLAFKLDKLNDKKARFESHESYLKKCLTHNLIPNGLKVYVEPSIGNRDDDFLTKWHSRLDEFSKTLTNDVVDFCKEELSKTQLEIETVSQKLKAHLTNNEFNNITEAIGVNQVTRIKELQQRKNRKFYGLKYRNNPHNRYAFNQQETRPLAVAYNQENAIRRERTDERTEPGSSNINEFNTRPGTSYANATKQQQQTSTYNNQLGRKNSYGRTTPRNRPSNRHLAQVFNNTNERVAQNQEPKTLSERISLRSVHRRNSKQNLPQQEVNITTERSRSKEIEELRKRLNTLEAKDETAETVIQHEVIQQDESQKNMNTTQRMDMGANKELAEMKTYLKSVMETISAFDKRLTRQLNTGTTPSEGL